MAIQRVPDPSPDVLTMFCLWTRCFRGVESEADDLRNSPSLKSKSSASHDLVLTCGRFFYALELVVLAQTTPCLDGHMKQSLLSTTTDKFHLTRYPGGRFPTLQCWPHENSSIQTTSGLDSYMKQSLLSTTTDNSSDKISRMAFSSDKSSSAQTTDSYEVYGHCRTRQTHIITGVLSIKNMICYYKARDVT